MNNISGNSNPQFSDWEYRNIALAVVAQCAQLVHSLAFTGKADQQQINACIAPLFMLNPDTTADVYPDIRRFGNGLDILQKSLTNAGAREYAEPIKYVLGITVLQQQLVRVSTMQAQIRRRLQQMPLLQSERNGFATYAEATSGAPSEAVDEMLPVQSGSPFNISALAALYQETISKLTFRIHVKGNVDYLKDPRVADNIRALLLAGIRSAMLWHQLGGRRWHLIVYKKRIRDCATHVRRSLMTLH